MAEPTRVTLATATPGGGFPFFGDNAAAVINETDQSLKVVTQNTKGSTENIGLLNDGKVDIALVAGEPAYEAFQGIGQPKTTALVIQAIYSNPGMFAVRGDSPAKSLRDLIGKPIAWGTRASGLTLLGRYVTDGLGLDRDKDFEPHYLEKAGDGPLMVADGRVAALWGGGIGWPGFTAVMQAGGRFIGLDRRRGGEGQRQAQFPETHHRAGRRLSGPEGAGEFGRLVELHPGAHRSAGRRRLSARQGAARRPRRAGEAARSGQGNHAAEHGQCGAERRRKFIRACRSICARSAC